MPRNIIIAGDFGGTKGDLLIADADTGHILKRFRANGNTVLPPEFLAQQHYGGIGRSNEMGHYCLDKVLEDISPETAVIGFNGMHWDDDYFAKRNINVTACLRLFEGYAAMLAEGCQAGISTVVGTGATTNVMLGDDKKPLFIDSFGPVCGDWGGAYATGQQFIRNLFREQQFSQEEFWEINEMYDYLQKQNCTKNCRQYFFDTNQNCWKIVSIVTDRTDRNVIASLAKFCDNCAQRGSRIAREVLEYEAGELANTIRRTVAFYHLHINRQFPLIVSGSVIANSNIYYDAFKKAILTSFPEAHIIRSHIPQVVGYATKMFYEIKAPAEVLARFRQEASELEKC